MATRVESLHAGDELPTTSEAVAEVEHFDGSLTRLDAGAVAQLGRLADPDGRPHVVITLGTGDSWHRTSGESSRHGQYEAHTPSAVAMARDATFVVRTAPDGSAWFAALHGAVVVRGQAGGTIVLHAGEAVTTSIGGSVGEVARPGLPGLAEDEWVAMNEALDAAPVEDEAVVAHAEPAVPEPAPRPVAVVGEEAVVGERDHPWRVGVAAVLAIGLGVVSVVIGRSAGTPHDREDKAPEAVVPGPPSYAGPPVATPTTAPPAPAVEAVAAPRYDVTGRACTRRSGAVHYSGTIRNDDAVARDYTVQVRFVNRSGVAVAETSTSVVDVAAGTTRSFHAVGTGASLRLATDCEVGTVSVG
ncbi:MAG TPA: FxLYD domain-containing protein [Acidimicrobiales bacterium]|nr:FxLYD domain-containing protein [Acidimicrobiales bacterium]